MLSSLQLMVTFIIIMVVGIHCHHDGCCKGFFLVACSSSLAQSKLFVDLFFFSLIVFILCFSILWFLLLLLLFFGSC